MILSPMSSGLAERVRVWLAVRAVGALGRFVLGANWGRGIT